MIRDVSAQDLAFITQLYNHFIEHTVITFEEEKVSESEILKRINKVKKLGLPWLIAEHNGQTVGYAYASTWREREAYRFTVETTVYIDPKVQRQGIGKKLYLALFEKLKAQDIRVALGSITLPNEASVALHEKVGMTKVAEHAEVGYKFGQWLDVGFWQIKLA